MVFTISVISPNLQPNSISFTVQLTKTGRAQDTGVIRVSVKELATGAFARQNDSNLFSVSAAAPANLPFRFSNLKPGTTYEFRIAPMDFAKTRETDTAVTRQFTTAGATGALVPAPAPTVAAPAPVIQPVTLVTPVPSAPAPPDLLKQLQGFLGGGGKLGELGVIPPVPTPEQIKKAIEDGWRDTIAPVVDQAVKTMEQLLRVDRPINIDEALVKALTTGASGLAAGFGIYLLTTLTDLAHPVKGTGLVPMGIDITNHLGTGLLTRSTVDAYIAAAITRPLGYYYNEKARPFRPFGGEADNMFFKRQLTKEQWAQIYRWQGWPDDLMEKHFTVMFKDLSDLLLARLIEDPDVDIVWLKEKMQENGYTEVDAKILLQYAGRQALRTQRNSQRGISVRRYKEGFIDAATLDKELKDVGIPLIQREAIKKQAILERETEHREDYIRFTKQAFQNDLLTEEEFTGNMASVIVDKQTLELEVGIEVAKKARKPVRKMTA